MIRRRLFHYIAALPLVSLSAAFMERHRAQGTSDPATSHGPAH
jgi:hypothetical protein